jgi:hypothetical protein
MNLPCDTRSCGRRPGRPSVTGHAAVGHIIQWVAGHSQPTSTVSSGGSTHAQAYPPGHEVFPVHARRKFERFCRISRSRNDYLCERFLLSHGPQQWSTFQKPACRTGGDAGAAPAGSTIGLYARATTREPRRSGLRRLRKQQGEGLAAPSVCETHSRRESVPVGGGESASGAHRRVQQRGLRGGVEPLQEVSVVCCQAPTTRTPTANLESVAVADY